MAENWNQNQSPREDLNHLLRVCREKLAELQKTGRDPSQITKLDVTMRSAGIKENYAEWEGEEVSIAGRTMSKRVIDRASFYNVQDLKDNIQSCAARDSTGEEEYEDFKKTDISGIVGLKGTAFTTRMGEISVHTTSMTPLPKSLQILPKKYHGLTNTDTHYRQGCTDSIMNEDTEKTPVMCSHIVSCIRRYLDGQGFLEMGTSMLVSNAGGIAAGPSETHYNTLDEDVKPRTSLELYLKRLIVGGVERVYEIGHVFRNEGLDTRCNSEFILMKLYQAYIDYYDMMGLTENMFHHVAQEVYGTTAIPHADIEVGLGKPFEELTMIDAIKKYIGIDLEEIKTTGEAKKLTDERGVRYEGRYVRGGITNLFFEEFAEGHLIQPAFIMDHPVEVSPLTKGKPNKPKLVGQFGLPTYARETCNVYSELGDPINQRKRFKTQEAALATGDEGANTTDEDPLNALEIGVPPTDGIGYGINRLVILSINSPAIRDVLLFPIMKSLGGTGDVKRVAAIESTESAPAKISELADLSKVKTEPLFGEIVNFDTPTKSNYCTVKVKDCVAVPGSKKLLQFTLNDGSDTDRIILNRIHEYYEPEELIERTCIAIVNLPPREMMDIDSCGMLISAIHEEDGKEGLNLLMVDDRIPMETKLY